MPRVTGIEVVGWARRHQRPTAMLMLTARDTPSDRIEGLAGSVGFSLYASVAGRFNETYGTLGGVIVLLLWLYLSGFAILFGAELNAELERGQPGDVASGSGATGAVREPVIVG